MIGEYDFKAIQSTWSTKLFDYHVENEKINKKKYILEMLPYPSGKIHMGHVRNYMIGDVIARYYAMNGFDVIHPMGWDSFGLPAENAAIQSGIQPAKWTYKNISEMKAELQSLGYMYDWDREICTCSSDYYSHEQKIFLDLYRHDLVYRKKSYVNWDPVEQTVLANEQVIDGKGWRSGAVIEKKILDQWFIRITKYADELLEGLKELAGCWPDNVIKMQENWIGKSDGAIVHFDNNIDVFTTRPDTLFGASFVALSPDHPISEELGAENDDICKFIQSCRIGALTTESIEKADKLGIFTGIYVSNPVNDEQKIPVYIANFVLMEYGTGAVFGCPAHDERDFEFAMKYNLPIKRVVISNDSGNSEDLPYVGDGIHVNSDFLDGMNVTDAKKRIIEYLEKTGKGHSKTTYKLRDWLVSRQRYWGCPIPFVHCEACGIVPEKELPVLLPVGDDVSFNVNGNPLEKSGTWKHTTCPVCGAPAIRETDTLDTFFESSWYFLRYLDNKHSSPINKELSDRVMPVDLYIGGVEHAVLHLLYARFFTLALRDIGYISFSHPFKNLLTQGMVCHRSYKSKKTGKWLYPEEAAMLPLEEVSEGSFEKMSKSKKNVINPKEITESHGVDAVRLFIISDTPPEKDFLWNTNAIDGSLKFLKRVWKAFSTITEMDSGKSGSSDLTKITHVYIKKIGDCIEKAMLNKAVAYAREFFNSIEKALTGSESYDSIKFAFTSFVKVMFPITPFIASEIMSFFKDENVVWPKIDEKLATVETIIIAVQVNGKLRATFETDLDTVEDELAERAIDLINVAPSSVKKTIVVKNKIVSFVV
jgi:leucyl-tRNA synthetase